MPSTFTVFFEDPFWVGVLEVTEPDGVRAARHVFGAEPTNPELLDFAVRDFGGLLEQALSSPIVPPDSTERSRVTNPKRLARAAAREQGKRPVSTAAQEALARGFEESKAESRAAAKRRRAAEDAHRRELARAKAKQRHRGR
ncbi:YjdF family protein [Streptomyces tubbatahanensis]|uniref:YjdF family protein n=1 Tax=Streptomyces tubbatahanensis TaxID=2923272 RepID=A0ABY3XXJ0_9ACTN|nr:YjdF family protein [Streptomyces tubbatahanensis]UNS99099.1 YjdF family protein [Streptomyces tubbatahanensis]